jgi:hypothetical protein
VWKTGCHLNKKVLTGTMFVWLKIYVQYFHRFCSTWYKTIDYISIHPINRIVTCSKSHWLSCRKIGTSLIVHRGYCICIHPKAEVASQSSRIRFAHGRLFPGVLLLFYVIKTALHHKAERHLKLFKKQTEIKLPTSIQSWNNKVQSN